VLLQFASVNELDSEIVGQSVDISTLGGSPSNLRTSLTVFKLKFTCMQVTVTVPVPVPVLAEM
jgi:hypothetical protein